MPAAPGLARRASALCVMSVSVLAATGCQTTEGGRPATPVAEQPRSSASVATSVADSPHRLALAVLSEWDAERSEAFASGDETRLRRLYVAGSPLADLDIDVLRGYRAQGLRLSRVQQQVVSVEVYESQPRSVTMAVVERLAGARVEPSGLAPGTTKGQSLPTTAYVRRVLSFERSAAGWRLSSASEG